MLLTFSLDWSLHYWQLEIENAVILLVMTKAHCYSLIHECASTLKGVQVMLCFSWLSETSEFSVLGEVCLYGRERSREKETKKNKKEKPRLFWDFKTLRKPENFWQATIDECLPKLINLEETHRVSPHTQG